MLRFANPEMAVWLMVLLPVVFLAWFIGLRLRMRSTGLPLLSSRRITVSGFVRLALMMLSAVGLIGALMVPEVFLERREPIYERPDMIIVLDRSLSMRATDIQPARLERATAEIKSLLGNRGAGLGRVGLVTFSGTSVIMSYLTSDRDNILFYLDWLVEEPTVLLGTNIGAAMASAREVAEQDESDAPKLFVLLSDGEDFGAALAEEVANFQQRAWEIHTIGIGGPEAVRIPLPQQPGAYLVDEQNQPVLTQFSEATLRRVAESTGGLYARSTTGGELARALTEILDSELKIIDWETTGEFREVHRWALLVALASLTMLVAIL